MTTHRQERKPSPREAWLSTVCDLRTGAHKGAPRQSGAFRVVMTLLAMYADHETGGNSYPSMRTLQQLSRYKHAAIRAALDVAIEAGYIAEAGTRKPQMDGRPLGGSAVTVWQLGYPDGHGGTVPWSKSASPPSGTTATQAGESTQWDHSASPPSGTTATQAGESTQWQSGESTQWDTTSKTLKEEEETRPDDPPTNGDDRAAVVRQILPPTWRGLAIQTADPGLAVLDLLQADGWTARDLRAACTSLALPRGDATRLLVAHLRKLRGHNPATLVVVGSTTTEPECSHHLPRHWFCRDCENEAEAAQLVQQGVMGL